MRHIVTRTERREVREATPIAAVMSDGEPNTGLPSGTSLLRGPRTRS